MPQGFTTAHIPDLSGRRGIVTGGNSGIGLAAATALAAHGMHVIIACRDATRGATAANAIRAAYPVARVESRPLDLADLASVRGFAATVDMPLDLLVNNAGVMALPLRRLTADGYEMQLGTNHLGHFALTGHLLPALRAAPAARIVSVSSLAHHRGEIRFDDLQLERNYRPWRAYTQSKLANLMFALELQRRLAITKSAAISLAAHPGIAATNLPAAGIGNGSRLRAPLVAIAFRLIGQSAARGALPILMAATTPGLPGGTYLGPDGLRGLRGNPAPAAIAPQARDAAAMAELWCRSERLTGIAYPSGGSA